MKPTYEELATMLEEITEAFYVHPHDGLLNDIRERARDLYKRAALTKANAAAATEEEPV